MWLLSSTPFSSSLVSTRTRDQRRETSICWSHLKIFLLILSRFSSMADEPFLTRWSFQVPILYLSLCLVTEKIWGGSEIEILNRNFFYHCEASTKLRLVILFVSENFRSFLLPFFLCLHSQRIMMIFIAFRSDLITIFLVVISF